LLDHNVSSHGFVGGPARRQHRGVNRVARRGGCLVVAAWLAAATPATAQQAKPEAKSGAKPEAKSAAKPEAKSAAKPEAKSAEGKAAAAPAEEGPAAPPAAPEAAEPPATAADLAALKAEIQALREAAEAQKGALDAVSAELSVEREQRAEEVISLQAKAEKAREAAEAAVHFGGFVQADSNLWNQASHDELNQSNGNLINDQRFLIRRARLKATIEREYTAGVLEFDGNTVSGATARIISAEASAKIPGEPGAPPVVQLSMGLFKIPFGFELLQSDKDRLFMERSNAERALFPGEYDVGVRLSGGWRFARYAIAVQNGEPLGERSYPGRDPNAVKDVTGRIGVETPITDSLWIAAGVSALSGKGFHPGTPATKATIQWNDANQNGIVDGGEIRAAPGMAAAPSRNFIRFGYGADLRLGLTTEALGTTVLYGELYLAQDLDRGLVPADPYSGLSRDLRELGGYVALTQDLGPHLAAGLRYDVYDPDRDSADPARPLVPTRFTYQTVSAVVAAVLGQVRLSAEYDHNTNHNGRDSSGNPRNLDSDTIVVRGQVIF
jgi:hypothetical protein